MLGGDKAGRHRAGAEAQLLSPSAHCVPGTVLSSRQLSSEHGHFCRCADCRGVIGTEAGGPAPVPGMGSLFEEVVFHSFFPQHSGLRAGESVQTKGVGVEEPQGRKGQGWAGVGPGAKPALLLRRRGIQGGRLRPGVACNLVTCL